LTLINIHSLLVTEERHDDGQADRHLGGGDDQGKNGKDLPAHVSQCRAKAAKLRLTAFSISSMEAKMMMALRRVSTPAMPMQNRKADRIRKWCSERIIFEESESGMDHSFFLAQNDRPMMAAKSRKLAISKGSR